MGARQRAAIEELLASRDTQAFGIFYDRHVRTLLGYFARGTRDPQVGGPARHPSARRARMSCFRTR